MAVPKRKKSKSKIRMRRSHHKVAIPTTVACSQCSAAHEPHRVCPTCGYYGQRQVITIEAD